MEDQGLVKFFHEHLKLPMKGNDYSEDFRRCSREWRNLSRKIDTLVKEVKIGLVGKYTQLEDAYASVTKALQHAAMQCNLKLSLKVLLEFINLQMTVFSIVAGTLTAKSTGIRLQILFANPILFII